MCCLWQRAAGLREGAARRQAQEPVEAQIAIIGRRRRAGVGHLLSRGARVSVTERANQGRRTGAGMQMSPNAVRVLRALGLDCKRPRKEAFAPGARRLGGTAGMARGCSGPARGRFTGPDHGGPAARRLPAKRKARTVAIKANEHFGARRGRTVWPAVGSAQRFSALNSERRLMLRPETMNTPWPR